MMRKSVAAVAVIYAVSGALTPSPAAAGAPVRTLASGVYVTPAGRLLDLPSLVPVAQAGTYKTSGRPVNKACALRAVDVSGVTVANSILVKARSATVRIPASTVIVEVSGPCKWRHS